MYNDLEQVCSGYELILVVDWFETISYLTDFVIKQVCLGCEGIICAERFEAYKFLTDFLVKNTPARPAEKVNVVAGDGFFNQEMVKNLG